jgi:uncharacterized protein YlaN (UPF0358 family)
MLFFNRALSALALPNGRLFGRVFDAARAGAPRTVLAIVKMKSVDRQQSRLTLGRADANSSKLHGCFRNFAAWWCFGRRWRADRPTF